MKPEGNDISTNMANALPPFLKAYHRTATFSEHSIPGGLRREHSTKPGVWGVIHVISGILLYTVTSQRHSWILNAGQMGLVEPEIEHHVTPLGAVSFYVEFWK